MWPCISLETLKKVRCLLPFSGRPSWWTWPHERTWKEVSWWSVHWYTIMRAIGRVAAWSEQPEASVKMQNNEVGNDKKKKSKTKPKKLLSVLISHDFRHFIYLDYLMLTTTLWGGLIFAILHCLYTLPEVIQFANEGSRPQAHGLNLHALSHWIAQDG